ncbi:SDR family NAD(P)-dependent oxidoreductase [Streptomyces sp. Je 1-4]|uniref:SDR family NAD(P)-dependent oxidoreductase n=1 Tax=Streptomyces TaxID=1883 RepID=UPI00140F35B7|nr:MULTISPECIES: SDR family NAD(P)-dependent oxidoreductase [unclassified Streptomyces]QIK05801.1 SDR family NAD(P)-dependent oxidoreductase [Streptomyces sp. ID38640]UYB39061.1 SDR family NAD(P)-dependent oxidoreductase [Streptomyces sp. Je 1-4]UZQ35061.1 SDR family NAD(P)-dependent oxidoreductase [Streptomyces sp. Je 1-4] [Streptomyces sp. Je 1-4 4N24]UZQ42479.1 SDR family NAD(P)-dependent oxidoreductase [Streptomyces sp. Je 1-4] [Streptomyces sp. Je 1-4 4N24_ara]
MDLGIAGRWALVSASSRGLGRACAAALAAEGVNIVLNGRDPEQLAATAKELTQASPGPEIRAVAADLTTAEGRSAFLAACDEPDILITNSAGPQPGALLDTTDDQFDSVFAQHFFAPIDLVRAVVDGMRQRRFGRIVNITSAMVATPHPLMVGSAGARTGLTAVMKGFQRQTVVDNVTINQLMPERIDSGRQQQMAALAAEAHGISVEEARRRQTESIAARRLGDPAEVGAACAFLCSVHASYLSGVGLRLDGGSYPGLL